MTKQMERVLIVDDDVEVRDLLKDQIFRPTQYEVLEARDGVEGVAMVEKRKPDLIYIDLVMPGLTGKDMLVAIKSRQYTGPIIVGVKRGSEKDAIEAFRFGATDYITKPIREAEMMSVVQRALADVRLRKERDGLTEQLRKSNIELEARIKELTTLATLGQTLTAMRGLDGMFDAVLAGALAVSGADYATLLLQEPNSTDLILRAGKNLTLVMQEKLGEPMRDELAKLVMTSQQPLVVEGDGLKRFKLSRDILATVYAPMVVNGKAIGVLTVGNHRRKKGFEDRLGEVINTLADYAAIAIVNARLFNALEQRAKSLEAAYNTLKLRDQKISSGVFVPLGQMQEALANLANIPKLSPQLSTQLLDLTQKAEQMRALIGQLTSTDSTPL
ncbi:MAG: response regulator [Anaerolineae bacterium]|nr:response regulator [Anaerolineae bacterium]